MQISIAMCTYNGSRYLQKQLASFAAQTYLPSEVIVCDDGSSDSTLTIVHNFASQVPFPVRVFRNEMQLGSTKNFEKALSLCTGELIALSDQDDEWYPNKLDRALRNFRSFPDAMVSFSDAELIDANSRLIGRKLWSSLSFSPAGPAPYVGHQIAEALFRLNYVATGATMVCRSKFCKYLKTIPAQWFHDAWISWIAASRNELLADPEPSIKYRVHEDQQVGIAPASLRQKAAMAKTNAAFFRAVSERLAVLRRFLKADSEDSETLAFLARLDQKIEFMKQRSSLSESTWSRALWILRSRREYHRYSRGAVSMLSDAFIVSPFSAEIIRKA